MARSNSSAILRQIHTLFTAGSFNGLSDRQLLDRFVACRDAVSESAFTVLVERHGPMVLGVCRRMLADPHDAEDAFQATFLVLVRKAGSIRVEGSVGRWLFGVAARVAARARENSRRRRGRERSGLDRLESETEEASTTSVERAEMQSILAEELGKLPARFQAPVLLCDLEGWSHEEAARRLGWPVGTVKSRLWRARARLRGPLTRRGLAPEELSIAIPLLPNALPRSLVEATTRAAQSLFAGRMTTATVVSACVTTLTEGVLRTMFLTKIKLAAAALLVILTGSAALLGQATARKPSERTGVVDDRAAQTRQADEATRRNDELDVELLERAWVDAIPRRDASIINRIMADDFEGIDPVGNVFTKATYMPDLRKGVFSPHPIELDEIKIRLFSDTAVVTSRIKIGGAPTGGRMTNVYVKRQGRWQCVASHASGIALGAGPVTGPTEHGPMLNEYIRGLGGKPARPAGLVNFCAACHLVNSHGEIHPSPPGGAAPAAASPSELWDLEIRRKINEATKNDVELIGKLETKRVKQAELKTTTNRPDQIMRIRPRFECLVDKVHVKVGQAVKHGEPLVDLFSTDLAAAKNDYLTAEVQWKHDLRILEMRRKLFTEKAISEQLWADSQNDEQKSRLGFSTAQQKLLILGVGEEAIARVGKEDGAQKARLRLRSSVDGTVAEVDADPGSLYDRRSILMLINVSSSQPPAKP